ncbi:hypothetical protein CELL_00070 [Cellulomonas sp. T2.31MG-18]|uniref:hypothetical protein n=1 Tax=Cellulomonas sp. T2.31MG-18 TaxID=3157619 RepID=UPI0035E65408
MPTKTPPAQAALRQKKGATPAVERDAASPWWAAAAAAATVGMIASGIGLASVHAIYGQETRSFVDQAIAQDLVNLVVAGPATLLLAWLAWRGSVRAHLLWTGVLTFTVYNYVIYTMSIHVGPLFLAWVAVLGLTFFSLVGGLRAARPPVVAATLAGAPRRVVGWYLIVIAAVFTILWLSDIVPAVLAGRPPTGAADLALPSNPVHVLDLAVFLPAVLAIGRLVLLRRPLGLALAPAATVFLVMTGLPILVTPLVTAARGGEPAWSVMGPVGVITAVGVAVLIVLLRPRPGVAPSGRGRVVTTGARKS